MVKDRPLRDFLALIESGKPFALSRWDVLEWHTLFGERNGFMPRDGYWYFDRMVADLTRVITSRPGYHLSVAGKALEEFGDKIQDYINGCDLADLSWWQDAGKASTIEDIQALIGAVSRVPLVVVGPPHYRKARRFLRYRAFVDVPPRNAYLCVEDIVRTAQAVLEDYKKPVLVSVSGATVAPLIVDALHRLVGNKHQLVDFGSAWEPFTGKP